MRLWSIHPKYLDTKGLVAVWREALLGKKVLQGGTKSYRNHPQLDRFKEHKNPVKAMEYYLFYIFDEAVKRGFCFDKAKVCKPKRVGKIAIASGQLSYEFLHLKKKLRKRDLKKYKEIRPIKFPKSHQDYRQFHQLLPY